MRKRMVCICGIDKHSKYIQQQITNIQNLNIQTDISICTAGSVNLQCQLKLKDISEKYNVPYLDQGRQYFIDKEKIMAGIVPLVDYSQLVQQISVSKYWYDQGYQYVYFNHPDLVIYKDWTELYQSSIKENTSCVRPYIDFVKTTKTNSDYCLDERFLLVRQTADAFSLGSQERLPSICVLWNKQFLEQLYKLLPNYSQQQLYNYIQKDIFTLCNDIAMFDLNKKFIKQFKKYVKGLPAYYFSQNKRLNNQKTVFYHYGDIRHKIANGVVQ